MEPKKKDKKLQTAKNLAIALLDLLPDAPILGLIMAQLCDANQETQEQIWELFGSNE